MMIRRISRQPYSLLPLFDSFVKRYTDGPSGNPMAMDVIEREGAFVIKANLPGVDRENIKIVTRDDHLVIEARQESAEDAAKPKTLHSERYSGAYVRSVYIPQSCDQDNIKARFDNGVLELTIPKAVEKKTTISID